MKLSGKLQLNTAQKRISTKHLAGAVLVLLAALGIGIVIREFRFRSSREEQLAQDPRAVQPVDISQANQIAKEPEIQHIQEQSPIEEASVEPEPIEPEPVRLADEEVIVEPEPVRPAESIVEADEESEARVQEAAAEPVEEDPKAKAKRARAALAMIGYDPAADAVYIQLINDPSVSANDRHDLIEDLNDDGFPDPDNPTLDDLPMIEYRIDLIDDHAPYAMDKTNADAFKEARKDLVNMVDRLTQQ